MMLGMWVLVILMLLQVAVGSQGKFSQIVRFNPIRMNTYISFIDYFGLDDWGILDIHKFLETKSKSKIDKEKLRELGHSLTH